MQSRLQSSKKQLATIGIAGACLVAAGYAVERHQRVTYDPISMQETTAIDGNDSTLQKLTYGWDWDNLTQTETDETTGVVTTTTRNYGLSASLNADLSVGYSALTFWFAVDEMNKLIFNPAIFAEIGSHNWVTLHLWNFQYSLMLDFIMYRYTPFDVQVMVDMDYPRDYCYGVSSLRDVGDLKMYVRSHIRECYYGMFGKYYTNDDTAVDANGDAITDGEDCWWHLYYPQVPIWQRTFRDRSDTVSDVVEWQCSDYEYQREENECSSDDEFCEESDYNDDEEFPIDNDDDEQFPTE